MTRPPRVSSTAEFRDVWLASGLTKIELAELLSSSIHSVLAWTKKPSSKSAVPAPRWAVDLLQSKLALDATKDKLKSARSELRETRKGKRR